MSRQRKSPNKSIIEEKQGSLFPEITQDEENVTIKTKPKPSRKEVQLDESFFLPITVSEREKFNRYAVQTYSKNEFATDSILRYTGFCGTGSRESDYLYRTDIIFKLLEKSFSLSTKKTPLSISGCDAIAFPLMLDRLFLKKGVNISSGDHYGEIFLKSIYSEASYYSWLTPPSGANFLAHLTPELQMSTNSILDMLESLSENGIAFICAPCESFLDESDAQSRESRMELMSKFKLLAATRFLNQIEPKMSYDAMIFSRKSTRGNGLDFTNIGSGYHFWQKFNKIYIMGDGFVFEEDTDIDVFENYVKTIQL